MSGTYRNPIIPGFNPDPSIIRVNDSYFLVTSSFEFWPGIPIYHSTDLTSWKLINHVITRRSQVDMQTVESSGGLWAATLRHHNGTFYVSVGCTYRFRPKEWDIVIPRGFFVTTADIFAHDSWSDPVHFDVPGIDQDLFFDDDGKVYYSATNMVKDPKVAKHGLGLATFSCEIDGGTGSCLTQPRYTRLSDVGVGIAEGPHIFKKGGCYYLTTAEGGTDEGHQQWICRSKEGPLGPWQEGPRGIVNPILFNDMDPHIRNTGHLDFVEGKDGRWWAVFLGVRPQGDKQQHRSQLGRETFLAPVEWKDDWPVVNGGRPITLDGEAPGLSLLAEPTSWKAEFTAAAEALPLGWYHVRTPLKKEYSLSLRPGSLALYGSATRIEDTASPCMVLQKQTFFSADWHVELDFDPELPDHEAGTVVWWSQSAYASIGVRRTSEGNMEVVCKYFSLETGAFKEKTKLVPVESRSKPVHLLISARPTRYVLSFWIDESKPVQMGEMTTDDLTHRTSGKESPNIVT
ncbi:Hypothetical protein D9617_9g023350 [Elsinoe fawcettii]|nr:Hypothetical protein D9617_9g023350 [Elsinoe fawcettii]